MKYSVYKYIPHKAVVHGAYKINRNIFFLQIISTYKYFVYKYIPYKLHSSALQQCMGHINGES